ncbi:hypothetical protein D4764_04G0008050 [Takifugu flavidus]|uniref:Uncharacterized protein n=1 Tax=Takifugu flavidus TaxID=433684 RepID=A0A5C6N5Z0_9TELE|nr:hypothetical protein D4764_04G0008050 [Takifugu flavidus]
MSVIPDNNNLNTKLTLEGSGVEFSKPGRCCSARRDGEAEDAKKGEERRGRVNAF